jgi:hypothetical protein
MDLSASYGVTVSEGVRIMAFGRSIGGSNTGAMQVSSGLNRRRGPLEAYRRGPKEKAPALGSFVGIASRLRLKPLALFFTWNWT